MCKYKYFFLSVVLIAFSFVNTMAVYVFRQSVSECCENPMGSNMKLFIVGLWGVVKTRT